MVALLKNDIEMQRNKNWGFADHCKVLIEKTCSDGIKVCVGMSVVMSYYTKTGRARMKPEYRYWIYMDRYRDGGTLVGRFTTKKDAMNFYKQYK
jgi:hypothetical protein